MQIAIVLFPRLTVLDAIGPYQTLDHLPGGEVVFVAEQAGPVRDETGQLGLVADAALAEVPHPDVVLVPGGPGTDETAVATMTYRSRERASPRGDRPNCHRPRRVGLFATASLNAWSSVPWPRALSASSSSPASEAMLNASKLPEAGVTMPVTVLCVTPVP